MKRCCDHCHRELGGLKRGNVEATVYESVRRDTASGRGLLFCDVVCAAAGLAALAEKARPRRRAG